MAQNHFDSHDIAREMAAELEALRQELVSEIACALLVVGALGVWWFVLPGPRIYWEPFRVSLLLLVTGCTALYLSKWPTVSRAILLAGPELSLVLALLTVKSPVIPYFAILIVLANCSISPHLGLIAALLSTVPILIIPPLSEFRLSGTLLIWLALGISWASSRRVRTALGWAWDSQRRAARLLEELRDRQGQLNRTLAALTEATRRLQRTNNALAIARLHAEEASRLQEQFAANISHELRTPLNLIVGFSEMMVTAPQSYGGVPLPSAYRGDALAIYRSARHLSDLINDVLDLSQIDAGRMGIRKEPASLGAVVREAAKIVRDVAEARGLRLELDMPDDIPLLRLDRTRIRQVLLNLLANAIRFTDKGWIRVCIGLRGQEALIRVMDSGCGIAPDKLARVFEPFSQATEDRTREGSGLGLAVSKRFVELHGGRMWIESKEGQGTTVSFTLPIPEEGKEAQALLLRPSPAPRVQEQPLVLVLHDDPRAVSLLRRFLDGYEFASADTVVKANEIIQETLPVALIMDSLWAERSAAELHSLDLPRQVSLFTCPLPSLRRLAMSLGAVDFLAKPVTREDLVEALSRLPHLPRKVLIVDDDTHMVRLLVRMMRAYDPSLTVLEAFSGSEGLRIAQDQHPDLVFLDLALPSMADGFAFLREMEHGKGPARPQVIIVSAHVFEQETACLAGELRIARQAGFSLGEVLQTLQATLPVVMRSALASPAMAAAPLGEQPG